MRPRARVTLGAVVVLAAMALFGLSRHLAGDGERTTPVVGAGATVAPPLDAPVPSYPRPEARMRDDSEWSPPSQGIAVKLTTDKAVYRTGEPIALTLTVRNVGGAPWLLRLGPSAPPEAGSPLANAPLYDLSVLTLTQVGGERAWTLGPVPSNMFPVVGEWTVLDPGAAQSAHGRLTTWAWTSGHPATRDRDEPLAHGLGPGKYSLRGHFKASTEIRVGDRSGDDALASLREFFLESDASIEAFRDRGFLGISYADAIRLRGSRYRLWSGELDAPPWEFVVEP